MDENAENAEEELDKFLDDWQRRHQLRDIVATDILLRQVCNFHFREICRGENAVTATTGPQP